MALTVYEMDNCVPYSFICEFLPLTRTEAMDREFVCTLWYIQRGLLELGSLMHMSKYNIKNDFKTGYDLNKELN